MKFWLAIPALIVAAAVASADDVRSQPLLLHSPAPAARAMKYALLPDLMDTTPGNAADHYRRAIQNWRKDGPPRNSRRRSSARIMVSRAAQRSATRRIGAIAEAVRIDLPRSGSRDTMRTV